MKVIKMPNSILSITLLRVLTAMLVLTFAFGFPFCPHDAAAEEPTVGRVSPTVMMFHKWDMEKGVASVDRVAELDQTHVQFCVTLVSELNEKHEPQNFGLLRENRDGSQGNSFYASDAELRAEMKGWLVAAFKRAVEHKLNIAILLHLNAHGTIQQWRNNYDFDPATPIGGTSYEDALVIPVMESLEQAVPADWPVQISLQGEMGRTVFNHPQAWRDLLKRTRKRGTLNNAEFGLSFNHEAVSGQIRPDEEARDTLSQLWRECDFIGSSMYQRLSPQPNADDFTFNVGRFVGEFYGLGCPLPENRPLEFVEFGIGGGGRDASGQIHTPALTAADAARDLYLGTSKEDQNPWTSPELVDVRRQTYEALCQFLSQRRQRHPVRAAYLWNHGSWDVHGIMDPPFADPEIVKLIKQHNEKVKR